MKKKITALLLGMAILLCACQSNDSAKAGNTSTASSKNDNTYIANVEINNKVDEDEVVEYKFAPADLACNIPEGFKESDEEGLYISKKSKDVSIIDYVIDDSAADPTQVSKDDYKKQLEDDYLEAYGDNVDIEITQYDKMLVDDRPGLWIMYHFDFRGDRYEVLSIALYNGTESNYITYMQGPGADWMEKFIESATSLTFINREG